MSIALHPVAGDDVPLAGPGGRPVDADPDLAREQHRVAGEAVPGPALQQDPELGAEGHVEILDPVPVGPDQVDMAPVEVPRGPIADGDVVVTGAVVDRHRVLGAAEGGRALDPVPPEVEGDPGSADDQPIPEAVQQVAGERRVLGDHGPTAQRLGQRRTGGQHEPPGQERQQDQSHAAGGTSCPERQALPSYLGGGT